MISDFTSNFWSYYIAIFTVAGLLFCVWLLIVLSGRKEEKPTGSTETTHVWDEDLTELNNPVPNWLRWLFWGLLIFSVGYLIYYPGLGSFKGIGNWTSVGQFESEMTALENKTRPMYNAFMAMRVEDLARDQKAMGTAERIFMNECARCHGSDARGALGFKNLRSGTWNWGGSPSEIEHSIAHGRAGIMPAMGDMLGGQAEIRAVVAYMRSLSGLDHDASLTVRGQVLFEDNCAMCHGEDARGMTAIGASDLTAGVWTYGSSEQAMMRVVEFGINSNLEGGVLPMPAHKGTLSQGQIRVLTAYVWGLNNR